jgi:hypothetical protein
MPKWTALCSSPAWNLNAITDFKDPVVIVMEKESAGQIPPARAGHRGKGAILYLEAADSRLEVVANATIVRVLKDDCKIGGTNADRTGCSAQKTPILEHRQRCAGVYCGKRCSPRDESPAAVLVAEAQIGSSARCGCNDEPQSRDEWHTLAKHGLPPLARISIL